MDLSISCSLWLYLLPVEQWTWTRSRNQTFGFHRHAFHKYIWIIWQRKPFLASPLPLTVFVWYVQIGVLPWSRRGVLALLNKASATWALCFGRTRPVASILYTRLKSLSRQVENPCSWTNTHKHPAPIRDTPHRACPPVLSMASQLVVPSGASPWRCVCLCVCVLVRGPSCLRAAGFSCTRADWKESWVFVSGLRPYCLPGPGLLGLLELLHTGA